MRTLRALTLTALLTAVVAGAPRPQARQNPWLDPAALHFASPGSIPWLHDPVGADTAVIAGDPQGDGWYVMLVRWSPHHMSQPHWHEHDRYITVLSGTWWVGTGSRFAPDRTVPMPAGSVVTHFARHAHFDGAKDATCILEIVGQGPDTAHPAATLRP